MRDCGHALNTNFILNTTIYSIFEWERLLPTRTKPEYKKEKKTGKQQQQQQQTVYRCEAEMEQIG